MEIKKGWEYMAVYCGHNSELRFTIVAYCCNRVRPCLTGTVPSNGPIAYFPEDT